MEHYYSYKNVKRDGKRGRGLFCKQDINTLLFPQSRDMVTSPKCILPSHAKNGEYRERADKSHSSLQPSLLEKRKSSLLVETTFLKKNGSFLNPNNLDWEKQKKKRWSTSPTSNKKNHTLTLSESFVNLIMVDGKKGRAEKIFSQTLKKLAEHLQNDREGKPGEKKKITGFNEKKSSSAQVTQAENTSTGKESSSTLLILSDKIEKRNVHGVLQKAIDNVKPTLQVRKVRIARSIYQVPFIMKKERQEKNAVRWIIEGAKKKSRHSHFAKQNAKATFSECLALSVYQAFVGQGEAREKRDQSHRTAEANRAYLRYRWW